LEFRLDYNRWSSNQPQINISRAITLKTRESGEGRHIKLAIRTRKTREEAEYKLEMMM